MLNWLAAIRARLQKRAPSKFEQLCSTVAEEFALGSKKNRIQRPALYVPLQEIENQPWVHDGFEFHGEKLRKKLGVIGYERPAGLFKCDNCDKPWWTRSRKPSPIYSEIGEIN